MRLMIVEYLLAPKSRLSHVGLLRNIFLARRITFEISANHMRSVSELLYRNNINKYYVTFGFEWEHLGCISIKVGINDDNAPIRIASDCY